MTWNQQRPTHFCTFHHQWCALVLHLSLEKGVGRGPRILLGAIFGFESLGEVVFFQPSSASVSIMNKLKIFFIRTLNIVYKDDRKRRDGVASSALLGRNLLRSGKLP